jgi:hypothetical protein
MLFGWLGAFRVLFLIKITEFPEMNRFADSFGAKKV